MRNSHPPTRKAPMPTDPTTGTLAALADRLDAAAENGDTMECGLIADELRVALPALLACADALRVYLGRAADAVDQWEVSDEVRAMLLGEEYDAAVAALAALPQED